jgi:hypothetical protein
MLQAREVLNRQRRFRLVDDGSDDSLTPVPEEEDEDGLTTTDHDPTDVSSTPRGA